MLENKTTEAFFREQFELNQLRQKEAERKKQEEAERKSKDSLAKHKKSIEAMGNRSAQLHEYVKTHFDKQRQLTNCKGEKIATCGNGGCPQNINPPIVSKLMSGSIYVQCWMLFGLYRDVPGWTDKSAALMSLDDSALSKYWAVI